MDENTIAALCETFPADVVRERAGAHGRRLRYVPSAHVVERLNEALGHCWSFVIKEWRIQGEEVIVVGELEAEGIRKQGVGGSTITKSRDGGMIISLADDLKAATADCLKRCAMLLGVALHLYLDRHAETPTKAPSRSTNSRKGVGEGVGQGSTPSNGSRITERQLQAVMSLAESKGGGAVAIRTRILDQFGVPLERLDRRQASQVISALNNGGLNAVGRSS
jgi:hypothetical protein